MRLVNGSTTHILSPPQGCAHCKGAFKEEDNHLVGFKGQDGQVYCSVDCVGLAAIAALSETELGVRQ